MSSQTILYVDGDSIRVVQAETRKGSLVVDKMCSVDEAGLDACLHDIKAGSLTVCANFTSMRQHVLYLPITKERYLNAMVAGQLQDRFEETGEHSFFFSVLGETKLDGEKWLEVIAFVVDDSELNSLITRFSSKGRSVARIYPDVCALERLAEASMKDDPDYDKSIFCVADLGQSKTLFVLHKGKLTFTRDVPSPGFGIHEQDVQSVNMTISYCSQSLRIVPAKVLIMTLAYDADTPDLGLMLPTKWVALPALISMKFENTREYLVPLSVQLPCRDPLRGNLLPKWYRTLLVRSKSLDIMTVIVAVTLLVLIGAAATTAMHAVKARKSVTAAKREIREMESLMPRFKAFKEELDSFAPLLAYSNAQLSKPDMQRLLTMVSVLGRPEYSKSVSDDIKLVSMPGDTTGKGAAVNVTITGRLAVGTFTEMNNTYQTTLNAIRSFPDSELIENSMDLQKSGFHCTIQVRNK